MNPTLFFILFLPLLIYLIEEARNKKFLINNIIKKKNKGEEFEMVEFAKRFIDKQCYIYTLNNTFKCVIKEVSGNAILMETRNSTDVINLDFVLRIREVKR